MFARMKERRLAKAKAAAEREHAEALGEWKDTIEGIERALDAAKHYNELWDESQAPIIPKKNEELLYVVTGAELVEIKSRKINYGSTSHGVSIRIAKGVTYRPSVSRGSMQASEEVPTALDQGTFVITNQRAVFSGTKTNRTWLWAKLISVNTAVHQGQVLVFLPVENRMKTSGVHLGTGRALDVGLTRINLGIALATGRYDDHVAQIEADLRDVQADRPAPPQTLEGV